VKPIDDQEAILIQRDILEELDRFCAKNDLKYSLAYGSLLGAVRHKDMIPWDDDIDVMMPRADFEKLCKLYPEKGQAEYAAENHRTNPEIKTRLAYFTDTRTITYNIGYRKEENIQTYGLHIDIYPVDYIPDDLNERKAFFRKRSILFSIVRGASLHPEIRKNPLIKSALYCIKGVCSIFGLDKCIDALVKLCRKYENIQPTEKTEVSVLLEVGTPVCFNCNIFDSYSLYDYGEKKYRGVSDYDTVLKAWYGDYMKLPPENQRVPHKYIGTEYYWK
jgi:hypothetical protein